MEDAEKPETGAAPVTEGEGAKTTPEPEAPKSQVVVEPTAGQENATDDETGKAEPGKTFTQEQVDTIVKSRLEKQLQRVLTRYGAKDKDELDAWIGKAQSYDAVKEKYDKISQENSELKTKLSFIANKIIEARYDDVRAYFKGKGLEFSDEAIRQELTTHPEWVKAEEAPASPSMTIEKIGADRKVDNKPESDKEKMRRIFGI